MKENNNLKETDRRRERVFVNVSFKTEIFSNFSSTTKFIGSVKVKTIYRSMKKQDGKMLKWRLVSRFLEFRTGILQ
jgi:hypothetical protein